jgi:CubicO group peptidase (beta-lactamase class C family)
MRTSAALSAILLAAAVAAASEAPSRLPRSTPEEQGIASSAILAFVEDAEKTINALHSVMVLRHGHVVAEGWWEPYRRDDPHVLWSLSKSFTSTGVGFAVAEGKLSLDDTVLSFFPEDAPPDPGDNLKQMRVRDLLRMNTGHHKEEVDAFSFDGTGVPLTRAFLAMPVPHKPGTHFVYNTPATYMLSAIVQKVTGMALVDYLGPRLFEPLGMGRPHWDASAQGTSLGGFGLSATTEDIARFGQLYLQKGAWNGRQLLPAAWVEEATAMQTSNGSTPTGDWDQGYGYQFWRCRHGLYRGDGAFGQFCIVMPEQDAVVAITSGTPDMQGVMNLVWNHLLAGMKDGILPADAATHSRLEEKMGRLSLPPQEGRPTSPVAREVSGRVYVFPEGSGPIEAIGVETGEKTAFVVRGRGGEVRLPCGYGEWRRGAALPLGGPRGTSSEQPLALSGAWTADDTFTAKGCFYQSSFCSTMTLRFAGDELVLDQEMNVAFGPTKRPRLVGRVKPPLAR